MQENPVIGKKGNILIIAGEPSGDIRGGELLKELKQIRKDLYFWGIGGDSMQNEGVELVGHVRDFSIVGFTEVIKKLPLIAKQYKKIERLILERKPSAAILIDYPGFNLKIAKLLHKHNIPVIYYIIPQVWAWGKGRIAKIKKYVSKALVLFGFEQELLEKYGIDVSFVGHPLIDKVFSFESSNLKSPRIESGINIGLLPGSRESEVKKLLPVMLESMNELLKIKKIDKIILAESSNVNIETYENVISEYAFLPLERIKNDTFSSLDKSDFVIVASGTATLEAAVMQKPMIIVYRAFMLGSALFRMIMPLPYIGLANIVAGKKIVPELLEKDLTLHNLVKTTLDIISDKEKIQTMKNALLEVKRSLGEKGASRRAGEVISKYIDSVL